MTLLPEASGYLLDGHYYQYDLGWLIEEIKRLTTAINTIYDSEVVHYADPIKWDITSQYTQNTIVVDPQTGDAYISKQAVPYGTPLTNTDYWLPVFNYSIVINKIKSSIAYDNGIKNYVEKPFAQNDIFWYGNQLVLATKPLNTGDVIKMNVNVVAWKLSDYIPYYSDTNEMLYLIGINGVAPVHVVQVSDTHTYLQSNDTMYIRKEKNHG